MGKINSEKLNSIVNEYIGGLGFLGSSELLLELKSSRMKIAGAYREEINACTVALINSKSKAIFGYDDEFKNNVFKMYVLLKGLIKQIDDSEKRNRSRCKLFSPKEKNDILVAYVNEKIDCLARTIKEVNEPTAMKTMEAGVNQVLRFFSC